MYACMGKAVVYSTYETDGWGFWWAFDFKLIIRKAALHLSSVYLLPFYSCACQFLSPSLFGCLPLICFSIPNEPDRCQTYASHPAHIQWSPPQWAGCEGQYADTYCFWTSFCVSKSDLLLKNGVRESILRDASERKHWISIHFVLLPIMLPSIPPCLVWWSDMATELCISHSIPQFLGMHYTAAKQFSVSSNGRWGGRVSLNSAWCYVMIRTNITHREITNKHMMGQ